MQRNNVCDQFFFFFATDTVGRPKYEMDFSCSSLSFSFFFLMGFSVMNKTKEGSCVIVMTGDPPFKAMWTTGYSNSNGLHML